MQRAIEAGHLQTTHFEVCLHARKLMLLCLRVYLLDSIFRTEVPEAS